MNKRYFLKIEPIVKEVSVFFLVSFCAQLGRKKAFLAILFATKILKEQQSKEKKEQENQVSAALAFF